MEVIKIAIRREDSYEYRRDKIREAVDSEYKDENGFSKYDIQLTLTDKVLVKDWNESKFFEIPYTIDSEFKVTLDDPVEYDELWTPKKQIEAQLTAARADDKPVGIGWSPGIHSLFINKKPARLLVPEETILPTYKLLETKLSEGRLPLGIDHLNEKVLEENKILAKMNPLDVGEVKKIATDGQDIYITDSELTNPQVKELQAEGELPAFSMVGPIQAHECERQDVDFVLDYFKDITRFDFVEQGGCQTCKTGVEPTELILASKLSMEVDKLTDQDNNDGSNPTDQNPGEGTGTGQRQGGEAEGEPKYITEEQLDQKLDEKFGKLEELIKAKPEDSKVEARFADLEKDNKELKLEAKRAKVAPIVDTAINEGRILPVDQDMFMEAGLAAEDLEKWKKSVTERPVLVDLTEKGKILEAKGQGTFTDPEGNLINLEESSKQIDSAIGKTLEEVK